MTNVTKPRGRPHKDGLGIRVKKRRVELGMSQKELADKLDLNYFTMISQIELGYVAIPPAMWRTLGVALEFDPDLWVAECFNQIMPDAYEAVFQGLPPHSVSLVLKRTRM